MPKYYITEPALSLAPQALTHSGRGGAGNMVSVAELNAAAKASSAPRSSKASVKSATSEAKRFYGGRGGAGNIHAAEERIALSFADEYADAERHEAAQHQGHVGRGGAGNVYHQHGDSKKSDADRRDSASSNGSSTHSGFWGRLSGSHSRH